MSSPDDYLRHFVGGLPAIARSDACALAGLAEQLAELYQKASECWPELAVPAATFLPYVAQRVSLDKPLARALRALQEPAAAARPSPSPPPDVTATKSS